MDSAPRSLVSRAAGLLAGPALLAALFGIGLTYAHFTPSGPVQTHLLTASCTTTHDGYTLRFQARVPARDEGLDDLSLARWRTRFSFTHQGGGDPSGLATQSGSHYSFATDDSPVFAHLDGYDQPYGSWQRQDDSGQYARTNLTLDQPSIDASFAGGGYCTATVMEAR